MAKCFTLCGICAVAEDRYPSLLMSCQHCEQLLCRRLISYVYIVPFPHPPSAVRIGLGNRNAVACLSRRAGHRWRGIIGQLVSRSGLQESQRHKVSDTCSLTRALCYFYSLSDCLPFALQQAVPTECAASQAEQPCNSCSGTRGTHRTSAFARTS